MKLRQNAPCPCQSGKRAKGCCGPILKGEEATTPEALMRSRYTAYATGTVHHIIRTTHPSGPHFEPNPAQWHASVRSFCSATQFEGLTVHSQAIDGDRGEVHFTATLRQSGTQTTMEERSLFFKQNGRWLYHSALSLT